MSNTATIHGHTAHTFYSIEDTAGFKSADKVNELCVKCDGTGTYWGPTRIHYPSPYSGVFEPVCFDCMGWGFRPINVSSVRSRFRRRERAEALRAERAEAARVRESARREALAAKIEAERAAAPSGFLADVGERVRDIAVEVVYVKRSANTFSFDGPDNVFVIAKTAAGHPVIMSGTGKSLQDIDKGAYTVTGTVKEHGNRDGVDQTKLFRVNVKAA